MRIKFWGTRGTRPTPGRRTLRYGGNTTCIEIRSKSGELLVIDSGSGIAELGTHLAASGPMDIHLLITHTHLDHIQGFPFFAPAFVHGTRLTIVGPAGSIKSLQSAFADQMDPAYFPLQLDQMPAQFEFIERVAGETFSINGLRITPHELHHPIVTFGYRVEENSSSFVFATDNEIPTHADGQAAYNRLVDWCEGADLLAHDAQYSVAEYEAGHVGWGHSTYEASLALAEASGARQLAFFHHDPNHSDSEVDSLIGEALTTHRQRGGKEIMAFPAAEEQEIEL